MTSPAPDFPNDQSRWLIVSLSLGSTEEALAHLGQGWLPFTNASAVFICERSFARSRGSFQKENEPPRFFPKLPPDADPDAIVQQTLPGESWDDLSPQPTVFLEWDQKPVGWVRLWTKPDQNLAADLDWLIEASARILANRQRIEQQLLADKLEALGEFAAGAGHEINNPVATISGRVQGLLQSETDLERRRHLLTIGGQALRIRDMIGDTMLFARPPTPNPQWLDLQTVLPEIAAPLSAELQTADFQMDVPGPVPIFADRAQLGVVISELLRNSLDWLDNGGRISLSADAAQIPEGEMARIVIEDEGQSFPEEHEEHLFDPFFCGRQAGRGLGFGLPKCWRIVSNHQGRIGIASLPEKGTRITILWPAYEPNPSP